MRPPRRSSAHPFFCVFSATRRLPRTARRSRGTAVSRRRWSRRPPESSGRRAVVSAHPASCRCDRRIDRRHARRIVETLDLDRSTIIEFNSDVPSEETGERVYANRVGVKAVPVVPIAIAGRRTCALSVASFRAERSWTPQIVERLRFVAEILAAAAPAAPGAGTRTGSGSGSTDSTVLLLGETGTGKERFARALHNRGPRRQRPFVRVNGGYKPSFSGAAGRRVRAMVPPAWQGLRPAALIRAAGDAWFTAARRLAEWQSVDR